MSGGTSFILKNGIVPWKGNEKVMDIHVQDGRIAAVDENIMGIAEHIDVATKGGDFAGAFSNHKDIKKFLSLKDMKELMHPGSYIGTAEQVAAVRAQAKKRRTTLKKSFRKSLGSLSRT